MLWILLCVCVRVHACARMLALMHGFTSAHPSLCDRECSLQQLLYTFDEQVCVSSCSLNKEETLLGEPL